MSIIIYIYIYRERERERERERVFCVESLRYRLIHAVYSGTVGGGMHLISHDCNPP